MAADDRARVFRNRTRSRISLLNRAAGVDRFPYYIEANPIPCSSSFTYTRHTYTHTRFRITTTKGQSHVGYYTYYYTFYYIMGIVQPNVVKSLKSRGCCTVVVGSAHNIYMCIYMYYVYRDTHTIGRDLYTFSVLKIIRIAATGRRTIRTTNDI